MKDFYKKYIIAPLIVLIIGSLIMLFIEYRYFLGNNTDMPPEKKKEPITAPALTGATSVNEVRHVSDPIKQPNPKEQSSTFIDVDGFCEIVKQTLSEDNYRVTDNRAKADYELALTASTKQRSDGSGENGIISYYANVKGTLCNHQNKEKFNFTISNCYADGKDAEQAIIKAFQLPELKAKISKKIKEKIQTDEKISIFITCHPG